MVASYRVRRKTRCSWLARDLDPDRGRLPWLSLRPRRPRSSTPRRFRAWVPLAPRERRGPRKWRRTVWT